jgi:class 3 adenylate cyclase
MSRCPACGAIAPEGFAFCGRCGASLTAAPTRQGDERRVVTVLFCDLVGFTASSDQADPEDVFARLRPYHARLRREIEPFGGTVEKFIGDAVMAVFGAPTAHEDDAERAVRAGLRVLEAMAELNAANPTLELAVRVGITTGEAVVSRDARPELGEGIVTGDVVNTAARIQAVAPVGEVVVGEPTFRATRRVFDYQPAQHLLERTRAAAARDHHCLVAAHAVLAEARADLERASTATGTRPIGGLASVRLSSTAMCCSDWGGAWSASARPKRASGWPRRAVFDRLDARWLVAETDGWLLRVSPGSRRRLPQAARPRRGMPSR